MKIGLSRFHSPKIESKLKVISERLEDYVLLSTDIIINDERVPETELIQKVTRALVKLQKNNHYNSLTIPIFIVQHQKHKNEH